MKVVAKYLARFWGYLALAAAVSGFFLHSLGFATVLILSGAALVYFLVQVPVWCCALTREGQMCRENSSGLLLGCWRRQHKWQRLRQTFTPAGGKAVLSAGKSAGGFLSLLGGVVAGVQVLIAAGAIVFH